MQAMQAMLDHDSGPQHDALRPGRDLYGLAQTLDRVARWVGQTIPRGDLHGVALSVQSVLSTVGPQRMSQLAERERITQPGMTGVIHRLARAGLIERSAEPADGRIVLVTVTPQGRALLAERQAAGGAGPGRAAVPPARKRAGRIVRRGRRVERARRQPVMTSTRI
jgi:DNA-binding MarR family transcriptional regulator